MTVNELIRILQNHNGDARVLTTVDPDGIYAAAVHVDGFFPSRKDECVLIVAMPE